MPFGVIDTSFVDLPVGIDANYLSSLTTRSGLELTDLVREVDAAMSRINSGADPLVAALASTTTEVSTGRRRTGVKRVQSGGEYTVARKQYGEAVGHMLPIKPHELSIGFTEDGLHRISRQRFNEELDEIVVAWERSYLIQALERLFNPASVPVDQDTSAVSPGFAGSDGTFAGTFPNGSTIPGGYTHYGVTTPANLDAALRTFVDRLKKWAPAPFDLIGSESAIALIRASTRFVSAGSELIRVGNGTPEAVVDPMTYIGVWDGEVRVRHPEPTIGTDEHFALFKTYGAFSPQNPLAIRYDELQPQGLGVYTRSRTMFPLADAITLAEFGFGVRNRIGAAAVYIDAVAGAYAAPTLVY